MKTKVEIARILRKCADNTVKKTIGKSVPIFMHEVEVPKEVREWSEDEFKMN